MPAGRGLALQFGSRKCSECLPDELLDRRKQGFAMPLPKWLGGDSALASAMRGVGAASPVNDLLDVGQLYALQAASANGGASLTSAIHSAFILDQWFGMWRPS